MPAILGFLAAVVSCYLTIKYLLRFLQRHTFYPLRRYRLLLAAVILAAVFFLPGALELKARQSLPPRTVTAPPALTVGYRFHLTLWQRVTPISLSENFFNIRISIII